MDWRVKHAYEDFAKRVLNLRIVSWIHIGILLLYLMYASDYHLPRITTLISTAIFFSIIGKLYKWNSSHINFFIVIIYLTSVVMELMLLGNVQIIQEVEFSKGIMLDISMMLIPLLYIVLRLSGVYQIILIQKEWYTLSNYRVAAKKLLSQS